MANIKDIENFSKKKTLYVGGLDEQVDVTLLQAAFIPFGEIVEVVMPIDANTQRHRGFGFVEFEQQEDAMAALDNMNNSELFGKVVKCNIARPSVMQKSKTVWDDEVVMKDLEEGDMKKAEEVLDTTI